MPANMDLDPTFIKALRLLHSKSKDSTEQLKQMVDEALTQKNNSSSKPVFPPMKQEHEASRIKKVNLKPEMMKNQFEEIKKKDKRPTDRYKSMDPTDMKRTHPDSPTSSVSLSPQSIKLDDSDNSEENEDDFAMVLELSCVVCNQMDVSSRNQLIECHECHNLYHQECHRPPALDNDINDPRKVWYCAKCQKNLKKLAAKPQKSKVVLATPAIKETKTPGPGTQKTEPTPTPFKRTEIKVPTPHANPVTGNKPVGLAALADDIRGGRSGSLSSKTKPFSSLISTQPKSPNLASGLASLASVAAAAPKVAAQSNPSVSRPPIPPPPPGNGTGTGLASSSLMSADKGLQKMKKKAAIKMQEKRRLPK